MQSVIQQIFIELYFGFLTKLINANKANKCFFTMFFNILEEKKNRPAHGIRWLQVG